MIRDGGGIVPKSTDKDTPKLPGRKCFACGSSERDHKWRECAERTDLTDAQKAAGAAAKAEAKAVRTGRPVKRSD